MIVTFQQATVDFWKEQGFEAEFQFEDAGYKYWQVDVPQDHKMLTSPAYLDLVFKEQRDYPDMIRTRFKAPMYVVMVGKRVAMTPAKQEGEAMTMPIARDLRLLRSIFTKPDKKQVPKYLKLKRPNQIVNAMHEVRQFGVQVVAYYMTDKHVETFRIDTVSSIIKPLVELVGADNNAELASENSEVQPVSSKEYVHPGDTG